MKPILLLFTVLTASLSFAQLPEFEWHEEYEDEKNNELTHTIKTQDGGYLLVGISSSLNDYYYSRLSDYLIIKINSEGSVEWKKTYGGDGTDKLSAVLPTPDGGYMLAGTSNSNKSGDKSQDSYNETSDYWVIKIDENGNKLWDTTIESLYSPSFNDFYAVDGEYFINGSYSYSVGDSVDYVSYKGYQHIEIDNNGMVISNSSHSYEASWYYSTSEDWVFTGDGGRIRVGRVEYDWYADNTLRMFSANGDQIWSKTVGDRYIDIIVNQGVHSTNGNYLIAGTHQYYGGDRAPWIAELDANGEYLWQRIYTEKPDMRVRQIISIEDGGYLILSGSEIIKISANGVIDWEYEIPVEGENYVQSIMPHIDGGYLISGNTRAETSEDNTNIWTLKLKSNPINEDNPISDNDLLKINFQDSETNVPEDYVRDVGEAYALRNNGYRYGWMKKDKSAPLSLVGNGRNREKMGVNTLKNTLIHMQYGDIQGGNGINTEGVWEIELANGHYLVTAGAGDGALDGPGTVPSHSLNIEGEGVIKNFVPSGDPGAESRFTTGSTEVWLTDGKLTIDATGGFNTKINYVTIKPIIDPIFVNFSRQEDVAPDGYLKDSGLPYSERESGHSFGWVSTSTNLPIDLSANTRNRNLINADVLQNTIIHMQYQDVGGTNGVLEEGKWDIQLPNGEYQVKVGAGDGGLDGNTTIPYHTIYVENVLLIDGFISFGEPGEATRFITATGTVAVSDGKLTIEALGGFNTKLDYIEIRPVVNTQKSINKSQKLAVNGIKSNLASIRLYPNPVSSILTIQWTGNSTIEEIAIYDIKGIQIKNIKPERSILNTMSVPVYQLQTGVYLLNVKSANGEVYKKRFIVK